jgi:chromosome segregation ATPase
MKESYSDFSIIKAHLELRQKYDSEIKSFKESMREKEEQAVQRIAALEQEVVKRNDYIKAQDKKLQEFTQKITEQEDQLRQMGLQLHKLKIQAQQVASEEAAEPESNRRRGLFK